MHVTIQLNTMECLPFCFLWAIILEIINKTTEQINCGVLFHKRGHGSVDIILKER